MAALTKDLVIGKLDTLVNTQDSINATSGNFCILSQTFFSSFFLAWLLFHRRRLDFVGPIWLDLVKAGDFNKRLLLLYVANDVMQKGKIKGQDDVIDAFSPFLADAMEMAMEAAKDEEKEKVKRLCNVWRDREVVSIEVLNEIQRRLNMEVSAAVVKVEKIEDPKLKQMLEQSTLQKHQLSPRLESIVQRWKEMERAEKAVLEESKINASNDKEQLAFIEACSKRYHELADVLFLEAQLAMQEFERLDELEKKLREEIRKRELQSGVQPVEKKMKKNAPKFVAPPAELVNNPPLLNQLTTELAIVLNGYL